GLRTASAADTVAALLGAWRAGATAVMLDGAGPAAATPAYVLDAIPPAGAGGDLPPLPAPDDPALIVRPRSARQALVYGHRSLAAHGRGLDEAAGAAGGTLLAAGDRRADRFWIEIAWALGRGFTVVVPGGETADRLALRGAAREARRALEIS